MLRITSETSPKLSRSPTLVLISGKGVEVPNLVFRLYLSKLGSYRKIFQVKIVPREILYKVVYSEFSLGLTLGLGKFM